MAPMAPLRLRCSVQNYDWGRSGEGSTVARLFSHNSEAEIEPENTYAEFWMGTHGSGPSFVLSGDADLPTLLSWIRANPAVLGEKVVKTWGADLPFLFKVLSVAKSLSIQAHPDKELAMALNKKNPGVYRDSNHKPEMAVALTEFEALCGFVSAKEFKDVIATVPEIAELVGDEFAGMISDAKVEDGCQEARVLLQSVFTKLMSTRKGKVTEMVSRLKSRLDSESMVRMLTEKEELVLLLEKQHPADIGVLSAYFFNHVKLHPGEALYIGANEPHAYISGECIECMATSDNVVRAGLTPKLRDVPTLCSMLTYKQGFPEILRGVAVNPYVLRYTPPFDEFEVDHCLLAVGESVAFPAVLGPSIFVVVTGEGSVQVVSAISDVREGDVFFVPAQTELILTAASVGSLQLYRAGVNSTFFGDPY